eukprot:scaffold28225_cov107-Isochrysis_galbana.AAC.3
MRQSAPSQLTSPGDKGRALTTSQHRGCGSRKAWYERPGCCACTRLGALRVCSAWACDVSRLLSCGWPSAAREIWGSGPPSNSPPAGVTSPRQAAARNGPSSLTVGEDVCGGRASLAAAHRAAGLVARG